MISWAFGKLWYSCRISPPMVWYSSLSGRLSGNSSLAFSMSRRPDKMYSPLPRDFATYEVVSCSSSISPKIYSTRSSKATIPEVPPNSSTTTANDLFCCMNSFISLLAFIVSGTMGSWRMQSRQSFGSWNISEEWM